MAASFRSRGRAARERSNRHAYPECIIDSFSQRFQKSYLKISSDPPKIYFGYANAKNVASGDTCVILRCSMRHTQENVQTGKLKCYVLISSENKKSRAKRENIQVYFARSAKVPRFCPRSGRVHAKISRLFPHVSAKISTKLGTLSESQEL